MKQSPFKACFEAGGCIADGFGRVALSPPVGQNFVLNLRSELQSSPAHAGAPCGFAPANKGHDARALQTYFGNRNIQSSLYRVVAGAVQGLRAMSAKICHRMDPRIKPYCISMDRWKTSKFLTETTPQPHGHHSRTGT